MTFVPNHGQLDARVTARGLFGTVDTWFTPAGVTLAVIGETAEDRLAAEQSRAETAPHDLRGRDVCGSPYRCWAVRTEFVGGSGTPADLRSPREGIISIFKGASSIGSVACPRMARCHIQGVAG